MSNENTRTRTNFRGNGRTSFIMLFPTVSEVDEPRSAAEITEAFAENCGANWRGILLVPGGKATVQLRRALAKLGNERGFAVFASEPSSDHNVVTSRSLRAANGIFVSKDDPNHPVRGWAELSGVRLTEY